MSPKIRCVVGKLEDVFTDFDICCDLDLIFTKIKSAQMVIGICHHKNF